MDPKIDQQQSGLRIDIDQSRARQAPKTDFGSVLSTGLSRTTNAVLDAGQLAAPYIPGGGVLSAAISGVGSLKSHATGQQSSGGMSSGGMSSGSVGSASMSTGGTSMSSGLSSISSASTSSSSSSSIDSLAASGDSSAILMQETKRMQELNQSFNLQYLQLQQNMQADNRQYTTLSNVMKTKHDTVKNSISNIR